MTPGQGGPVVPGAAASPSGPSRSLGLGSGTGRNSKLSKALLRLVQFGYLEPFGAAGEGYWVRTHVAPLSERHLDRAGPRVRQLHDHLMAGKVAR